MWWYFFTEDKIRWCNHQQHNKYILLKDIKEFNTNTLNSICKKSAEGSKNNNKKKKRRRRGKRYQLL